MRRTFSKRARQSGAGRVLQGEVLQGEVLQGTYRGSRGASRTLASLQTASTLGNKMAEMNTDEIIILFNSTHITDYISVMATEPRFQIITNE